METIEKQGHGLWTKPLMVEKGQAYWKMEGYCDNTTILLQGLFWYYYVVRFQVIVLTFAILPLITCNITLLSEYCDAELSGSNDKWFMFTEDEEKVIREYIATR